MDQKGNKDSNSLDLSKVGKKVENPNDREGTLSNLHLRSRRHAPCKVEKRSSRRTRLLLGTRETIQQTHSTLILSYRKIFNHAADIMEIGC